MSDMAHSDSERSTEMVLIIEDDPSISLGLEINLKRSGYDVKLAPDGQMGLALFVKERPDIVILDLMLPGIDGLEVLRKIREADRRLPVVILTAMGSENDKIRGLDLGANDYVTKPFSVAELKARLRAALRYSKSENGEVGQERVLRAGAIELHPDSRRVEVNEKDIELNSKEFDVLMFLMERPERVLTREQILSNVWGIDYEGTDRTVDNFVSAIRKKLGEDPNHPRHLRTVWGIGYRFVP